MFIRSTRTWKKHIHQQVTSCKVQNLPHPFHCYGFSVACGLSPFSCEKQEKAIKVACFVCPGIELLFCRTKCWVYSKQCWGFRQDHKVCEGKRAEPLSEIASSCWAALRWLWGRRLERRHMSRSSPLYLSAHDAVTIKHSLPYCKQRQTKALKHSL